MASPENIQKDKMVLLAQLKRYDEKIKQKIEDSASSGTIQATGIAPLNLSVESLTDGGSKIKGSLNIGPGLRVDTQHGLLMPSVDNETIEISTGQIRVIKQDKKNIEVSHQPSVGSVSAVAQGNIVFVMFNGVKVNSASKTLVGKITNPNFYPFTDTVGTVLADKTRATNVSFSHIASAFAKVETDGSIYINPLYFNGLVWSGTLIYLI